MTDSAGGWELLAQIDDSVDVVRALFELEPGKEYTQSEIADAADIPLKTLYLSDTLGTLDRLGMLERIDEDEGTETTYVVDADSELYQTAAAFGEAVATAHQESTYR